jgi:hypothetical protein
VNAHVPTRVGGGHKVGAPHDALPARSRASHEKVSGQTYGELTRGKPRPLKVLICQTKGLTVV